MPIVSYRVTGTAAVETVEELSPEWLTQAMREAGMLSKDQSVASLSASVRIGWASR